MRETTNFTLLQKSVLFLSLLLLPSVLSASPTFSVSGGELLLFVLLIFAVPVIFILGLVFSILYLNRAGSAPVEKVNSARKAAYIFSILNVLGGLFWLVTFIVDFSAFGFNPLSFVGTVSGFIPLGISLIAERKKKQLGLKDSTS